MLITTQNLGKTTVNELASAMGKVIPTANANNVQIDQLCAAYADMTAKGIATAESTTYLNSMLNELGKGGTSVDLILREKTGKSFSQLSADGNSLSDILAILKQYADENNKSFSDLWSSSEAGKAAMVLLGNGADEFNNVLAQMNDSTGATTDAFNKLDTDSNKAKKALNQIKNTATDLGQEALAMLQPMIASVSAKVKESTENFKNLDSGTKQIILTVIAVLAALAPVLIIIGKLCTAVSSIINIAKLLQPVIAAINTTLAANPIMIVIMAVAALIAIFVALYNKCEWFRDAVNSVFEAIKSFLEPIIEAIKGFIETIWTKTQEIWALIEPYIMAAVDTLRQIGSDIAQIFSDSRLYPTMPEWSTTRAITRSHQK